MADHAEAAELRIYEKKIIRKTQVPMAASWALNPGVIGSNPISATRSSIAPDPDFTGQDFFDCRTINRFSAIGINNWICGYN